MLRARREQARERGRGLDRRAWPRRWSGAPSCASWSSDLHDLPEDQRAALVLTELGDLSHAEVAEVLGCEVPKVKGLVFRARAGLIERRDARAAPCEEIRVELATARRGGLRRGRLRHHLKALPRLRGLPARTCAASARCWPWSCPWSRRSG